MQTLTSSSSSSLNPSLHLLNKETLTSISHSPPNPRNPLALFNRRHLLLSVSISPSLLSLPIPAAARGLFQMPPPRLNNRYFLVRAGESEYERIGIINTNPVAKTSVDNGLSEEGKRQAARAAVELEAMGACEGDCWIWPSITQRSYQAAEIIAFVNGVNRSHIVPEYSFLDARGLGSYEGRSLDSITEVQESRNNQFLFFVKNDKVAENSERDLLTSLQEATHTVYASDSISPSTKPPPTDNGTPNESVADVFVRVTQLMSVIETQYSGDTVIIVSPDSDNLTVLQAGLVGLDLRRHTDLSFSPGEIRLVDPKSIPTYKQPASATFKCLNPPSCT